MTTTSNHGTYAMYEKNVRGFLATQFGLSVRPYADAKIIVDFLGGRGPYQCARWRSPGITGLRRGKRLRNGDLWPPFLPSPAMRASSPRHRLAGSTGNGEC
jgi:hypothetical protein